MSPISSKTSNQLLMLPGPTNVSTRVMNSMLQPIISHRSKEFQSLLANIEDKLRQIFVTKHHVTTLSMSGTFLVRSGILNSVHTFASDPSRGLFILSFLILMVFSSIFIFFKFAPNENKKYTIFSKESFKRIKLEEPYFQTPTIGELIRNFYSCFDI